MLVDADNARAGRYLGDDRAEDTTLANELYTKKGLLEYIMYTGVGETMARGRESDLTFTTGFQLLINDVVAPQNATWSIGFKECRQAGSVSDSSGLIHWTDPFL